MNLRITEFCREKVNADAISRALDLSEDGACHVQG